MTKKPNIICPHYRDICGIEEQCRVVFYYQGYFSQNIISAMADAVRTGIEHVGAESKTRRRLFSSFVEMAQNIIHYSAESLTPPEQASDEMRQGSVRICKHVNNKYSLLCANPVRTEVADQLQEKLVNLRTMTMDDIKKAYKKILMSNEQEDGSKGAGLGFLTMARDASEPLEFEFVPSEEPSIAIFYLKAAI